MSENDTLVGEYRGLVLILKDEIKRLEEKVSKLEEENQRLKVALDLAKQEQVPTPPINVPPYLPGDPNAPWWTKPWMCNPCGVGYKVKQSKDSGV